MKLFNQNLANVSLKIGRSTENAKKHDSVFEITIFGLEYYLSFIALRNPYLIIDIC